MTIHLVVGLPGAGKTTHARELESTHSALRLTPDEWLMALSPSDDPAHWRTPGWAELRDRIEGQLIQVGLRIAQLGVDVVFDFGFWSRDERAALSWIAGTLGVGAMTVYLPIEAAEQRRRLAHRFASEPGQFAMAEDDLERWRAQFEPPDADELADRLVRAVPAGYATWSEWASQRWPSLPDRYR